METLQNLAKKGANLLSGKNKPLWLVATGIHTLES
jgi:hypothetical protein